MLIKINSKKTGFTLIEMLIVIALISVLASMVSVASSSVRRRAGDARRKAEIAQFGRFLVLSCYRPLSGGGDYDLMDIAEELKTTYPQYAGFLSRVPKDPKSGTDTKSFYRYLVTDDGQRCALYANLEDKNDKVTLTGISNPTPGGGIGVLQASSNGWNGTDKYFQVSN